MERSITDEISFKVKKTNNGGICADKQKHGTYSRQMKAFTPKNQQG